LALKLAVSLKFSYNTPISLLGNFYIFNNLDKKQIDRKSPETQHLKE